MKADLCFKTTYTEPNNSRVMPLVSLSRGAFLAPGCPGKPDGPEWVSGKKWACLISPAQPTNLNRELLNGNFAKQRIWPGFQYIDLYEYNYIVWNWLHALCDYLASLHNAFVFFVNKHDVPECYRHVFCRIFDNILSYSVKHCKPWVNPAVD